MTLRGLFSRHGRSGETDARGRKKAHAGATDDMRLAMGLSVRSADPVPQDPPASQPGVYNSDFEKANNVYMAEVGSI